MQCSEDPIARLIHTLARQRTGYPSDEKAARLRQQFDLSDPPTVIGDWYVWCRCELRSLQHHLRGATNRSSIKVYRAHVRWPEVWLFHRRTPIAYFRQKGVPEVTAPEPKRSFTVLLACATIAIVILGVVAFMVHGGLF